MPAKQTHHTFQRQQLEAWLTAYAIDRQLREPDVPARNTESSPPRVRNPRPAPGQIRLLPPAAATPPDIERPVYVLLLPGARHSTLLAVPFSRFDIPATPQEWRTGLHKKPLQVLCLWNARELATAALAFAWLVHNVTDKQHQQAIAACQSLPPLTSNAGKRSGPPLIHPLDPRHTYLQEEHMLLDDLCAALQETETTGIAIKYHIPEPDTQLLRAAEPPEYPQAKGEDTD
jgi:hypothetical protein